MLALLGPDMSWPTSIPLEVAANHSSIVSPIVLIDAGKPHGTTRTGGGSPLAC
jgi:hypothetical protein